jgi:hypothetical protein
MFHVAISLLIFSMLGVVCTTLNVHSPATIDFLSKRRNRQRFFVGKSNRGAVAGSH